MTASPAPHEHVGALNHSGDHVPGEHVYRDGRREFNLDAIRRDFPILKREVYGKPLVYLDNAATSQKPVQVIAELTRYYRDFNANIHRGVHLLSQEATAAYEGTRETIRAFINAYSTDEIIFTR